MVQINATERSKLKLSEDMLRQGMKVCEVARRLNYPSTNSFRKAFVRMTGTTPVIWAVQNNRETLARQRVRVAERLLQSTEMSLREVAVSVGFAHPSHMTNAFKAVHGLTPSAWKARQRT